MDLQIRKLNTNDFLNLVEFYKKNHIEEEQIDVEYFKKILEKNDETYQVLELSNTIKGSYSLLPVSKGIFEGIANGTVSNMEVPNFILNYKNTKEVYLYMGLFLVDIDDNQKKDLITFLHLYLIKNIINLTLNGINIKKIGAMSTSSENDKMLEKLGFEIDAATETNNSKSTFFKATVIDIVLSR